jgi:hypothetical protein
MLLAGHRVFPHQIQLGIKLYPHGTINANGLSVGEKKRARKWVTTVVQRQMTIEQAAPWLVSSISGLYIMARARHLSQADANDATLAHFLFRQSDVVLILCGCPALWHYAHKRYAGGNEVLHGAQARAIHQLRQVFTALMIGTGLLARKAAAGKTANLAALARRLNKIAHDGAITLEELGDPYSPDLFEHSSARLNDTNGSRNGNEASA